MAEIAQETGSTTPEYGAEFAPEYVEAPLTFAKPGVVPVTIPSLPGQGETRYEGERERHAVRIVNAWPMADELSLDREGFQVVNHRTAVDFYDDLARTTTYEEEVRDLIRRATGARDVIVFDHTLRAGDENVRRSRVIREPVEMVHNDYTERSGPQRLRDLVGNAEAEELLKRRVAVINVWRGNRMRIQSMPLAIADARSIEPDDLISVERRAQDRIGEIQFLVHNEGQEWYYFPYLDPDEVILIKCYDSDPMRARFTAHSAFADPTTPADAPARESIETRTFAIF